MTATRLILASASERRLMLLQQIGIVPDMVVAAEIDETPHKNELPVEMAERLAKEKALAVAGQHKQAVILAADTVVACGRRLLGKPENAEQARTMLTLLSGRRHRVYTSVAVANAEGKLRQKTVTSMVKFKRLLPKEIEQYIASGEWKGKAGGYAIQGLGAAFIPSINGSYSNVVGLPLAEALQMLQQAGYKSAS